jgi:hypothetical protein
MSSGAWIVGCALCGPFLDWISRCISGPPFMLMRSHSNPSYSRPSPCLLHPATHTFLVSSPCNCRDEEAQGPRRVGRQGCGCSGIFFRHERGRRTHSAQLAHAQARHERVASSVKELSRIARPDQPLHAIAGRELPAGPDPRTALAVRRHQPRQARQPQQPRGGVVDVRLWTVVGFCYV